MEHETILNKTYDDLDSINEIAKCIERGEGDHVALARAIVFLSVSGAERIDSYMTPVRSSNHG